MLIVIEYGGVLKVDGALSLTNVSEEIRLQRLGFKAWLISF